MIDAENGTPTRRILVSAGTMLLVVLCAGFMLMPDTDLFLKINKSIDIFGRVYKEVSVNYVDEIDPEKFMQAGIDGMLGTLDPYTVYIDREEGDEVDLLTSGQYGGIGVTIGVRDGAVRVINVMEGYSAQRQGIVPGDKFLQIDGVKVGGKKPDEVRSLTRGEPGTQVKILVEREGESKPLEFILLREEIQVRNVTYAGFVSDGIGYIRLERFSRKAGEEVRQAIKDLKSGGELKGVVLDLRGNPGGLLDAAVDIVSKFVPRGNLIVSTRGRRPEAEKNYNSVEEPILPTTPLAILTDRNSASASEIVAGAIQDLDRGIIVGTRTFGKGLVQTIVPLNYGAQLKITTARYYTPSGRSIQEIDYMHKDGNGVFTIVPDSLKGEFKTAHGRRVLGHGGVAPDSLVNIVDEGPMVRELIRKALFFKFAVQYVGEHKNEQITSATPPILDAFNKFLKAENFDYQEESEAKIKDLRLLAERSHYGKDVLAEVDRLSTSFDREKARGFERYKDHIIDELNIELMSRLHGEHGRIEASLKDDAQLNAAMGMLRDQKLYSKKTGG
jgi:carboxyl-terminal processing protease